MGAWLCFQGFSPRSENQLLAHVREDRGPLSAAKGWKSASQKPQLQSELVVTSEWDPRLSSGGSEWGADRDVVGFWKS